MVPDERLRKTVKNGTRYRAAGGQSLINTGERRIKFKSDSKLGRLSFQAIDELKTPLASAAKIANKCNVIVLNGDDSESYIFNKVSKQKIPIYQESGVYVMDADFMVDDKV